MIAKSFARVSFSVAVIIAVVVFAILYDFNRQIYYKTLAMWGVPPFQFPFVDTHAVLAAIECHRLGIDVYAANPCDVMGRPHVYSPVWLWLDKLPITTNWTSQVGISLCLLFALSLSFLPCLKTRLQVLAFGAFLVSPVTAYAVERGNNDVVIFVLSVLAVTLLRRGPAARCLGYLLVMSAGLLKFYPFAGLAISLAREKLRGVLLVTLAAVTVLITFVAFCFHQLMQAMKVIPVGPYFTDYFGAKNLPFGLAQLVAAPRTGWLPHAILFALLALWGVGSYSLAADRRWRQALDRVPAPVAIFLLYGAIILVGCFFAGQSIYYRGIFFLFVVPGLFALAEAARSPALKRRIGVIGASILFLMWSECPHYGIQRAFGDAHIGTVNGDLAALFWLVRELIWWRVVTSLSGLIACSLLHSDALRTKLKISGPGLSETA